MAVDDVSDVTGCETAGVDCVEPVAAAWGATAAGVGALGAPCVETADAGSEPSALDGETDAGAVDDVDDAGATAAAPDDVDDADATLAPVEVEATGADDVEEPLAAVVEALAASPLDAEPCALPVDLAADADAADGVVPALEPLADAEPAADARPVAAPETVAGCRRDMVWNDPEDVVLELWAVEVAAPHTRPLECWLSRPLIRESTCEPDPLEPGG